MKLAQWMDDNKVARQDFAARIGVTPGTITGYCDGSLWPKRGIMEAIRRETNGDVSADDFLSDSAPLEPERATP